MKKSTETKPTDIQRFSGTGTPKEASLPNRCTHLPAVAAIICAVALHPAKANAQGTAAPTDPQIVGIVETADDIDINYAKLALSKAKDKRVRDFAQQMITDHYDHETITLGRSKTPSGKPSNCHTVPTPLSASWLT